VGRTTRGWRSSGPHCSCRSTPPHCLGVGRSGCVDEAIGAVALADVEQHVGGHRSPAPGRVGADAFPGRRHQLLDRGRIVVAGNSGQADQARQQRLEQGPGGQIVAGGEHGQGPGGWRTPRGRHVAARADRPDPAARAARGERSTTASAPGGRGRIGPAGATRRPGSPACGTWRSSSSHTGTRSVPTGVHARVPLAVPQPNRAGSAIPQAISSPAATSGETRRSRPDRNSGNSGGRLVGSCTKDAPRR
jgi:hypothetical protein